MWRQADAQALPFADAMFDVIACQFGIMFFPDKAKAAAEARRVLKPGGTWAFNVWRSLDDNPIGRIAHDTIARFFVSDPPTFYNVPFGFSDERVIRDLLADAHFEVATCEVVRRHAQTQNALDAARGLVMGNPTSMAVTERATSPIEAVVDAVAEALVAVGGDHPFSVPMSAMVVVAHAA